MGDRWQVDETYVKVAGRWRYVYRAIDSSARSSTCSSPHAETSGRPAGSSSGHRHDEDDADRGHHRSSCHLSRRVGGAGPAAWHRTDRYANNGIECDHGRLKARLRPIRGLKQDRSARIVIAGHAFVQNVRRAHYELAVEEPANRRVAVAFDELALAI